MSIEKLYQTKLGGDLSPNDCQQINSGLSKINISDIPKEQLGNVADYLTTALNMNSVQKQHVDALDTLLSELQHST